ncbi:MAG TPA: DUF1223 domain-containing protein [Methylophilaceae bacterium]|jgi:hypothetical protein
MRLPHSLTSLIWPLAMFALPIGAAAAECSAQSGAQSVPLLELYTSEGCSSCPPADKWLSNIAASGFTSDKVVPLAFHVDYWDYIGWKDRFARPDFSARQRQVAAIGRSDFVYTPQVILNGIDFRGWSQNSRFTQTISSSLNQPARANLSLNLAPAASGEFTLKATAQTIRPADRKNADIFIAVYENKLTSKVSAGENNGRQLDHDYVVREWYGPYRLDENANGAWQRAFSLKPEWKGRNAGVATFVQDRTNGDVLQALALKFCS